MKCISTWSSKSWLPSKGFNADPLSEANKHRRIVQSHIRLAHALRMLHISGSSVEAPLSAPSVGALVSWTYTSKISTSTCYEMVRRASGRERAISGGDVCWFGNAALVWRSFTVGSRTSTNGALREGHAWERGGGKGREGVGMRGYVNFVISA